MSTGTKRNFSPTLGAKIWTASSFSTSSSPLGYICLAVVLWSQDDSDDDQDVGDDVDNVGADVDNIGDDDQDVDDAGDYCCQASLGTNTYRNLICLLGKPHLHPSTNTTTPTPFFLENDQFWKLFWFFIFPSQDPDSRIFWENHYYPLLVRKWSSWSPSSRFKVMLVLGALHKWCHPPPCFSLHKGILQPSVSGFLFLENVLWE